MLRKKTLNSILGSFSKVQKELNNFVQNKTSENDTYSLQVEELNNRITENSDDIRKAQRAAANIAKIIGE